MKLIAINTIRRGIKGKDGPVREQYVPGQEFEAEDNEGQALIEAGVARRKTREVVDDDDAKPKGGKAVTPPAPTPGAPSGGATPPAA